MNVNKNFFIACLIVLQIGTGINMGILLKRVLLLESKVYQLEINSKQND